MYGMHKTEQIEKQLPVLLEYVRIMSKRNRDYIPQPIASASTILYAIQEELISRDGDTFELTAAGRKAGGMNVLVACEFSGVVREAFRRLGHDAVSCDLLPAEDDSPQHIRKDIIEVLRESDSEAWDLLIAFPPCTHLSVSGARWFKNKESEQDEAVKFFLALANAAIPRVAIENPIGVASSRYRKPDQIIQPWQFGHGETKATCLWLKNLPKLQPTEIVSGRVPRIHHMAPGPERSKERSRTYQGIAEAMAEQWGSL